MASTTISEFAHLRIPLEDVLKATNNFSDKNIIGKGDFGNVYKGKLKIQSGESIKISARRLDRRFGQGDVEFWTEISQLSSLKHDNIVSMIGFCDEKGEKIIVNHLYRKGSLVMYLSNLTLTWTQRLRICVGVARALSYIHNEDGRSYSVIHRNINSSTVLLDDNFEAKLSGFEYSIKNPVYRINQVLISEAIGTIGYMDPEIEKNGGVTNKSDIYSFGVVLWEILCGRKAFIPNEDEDKRFLASLVRFHNANGTIMDIIPFDLQNQIPRQSLMIFGSIAYSSIRDDRLQRPNMNFIVHELEKALEFQLRYDTFIKINGHLQISLSEIKLATNNFSDEYHIESTTYYNLYRAELDHLSKVNHSLVDVKNNKGEVSKRRNTVDIKRIMFQDEERGEQVFYKNIETLTICKHPNIITLLGFCDQGFEKILVIEHASNGSLADYLVDVEGKANLTWEKRLKICLDVANGLKYLHYEMEDKNAIINHDIKSERIVLDENWVAKIVNFGYSEFLPPNQDETQYSNVAWGSMFYIDPQYRETGKSKRESDVYSFGVVLFEVLCGRLADDPIYVIEGDGGLDGGGLPYLARRFFQEGTLNQMIDPILMEENGHNQDSLDICINIAYKCLAETQDQRPTMNVVVKVLEKALFFQENRVQSPNNDKLFKEFEKSVGFKLRDESPERVKSSNADQVTGEFEKTRELNLMRENLEKKLEHLKIGLRDIVSATNLFHASCYIGSTAYYMLYMVELDHFDEGNDFSVDGKNEKVELRKRRNMVHIRRMIHGNGKEGERVFYTDLEMLTGCKHRNIVTLLGFCDEGSEKILVIENVSKGFLGDYLINVKDKPILTWEKRLRICLDVAHGLKYLHYEMEDQKTIINRDINSDYIALDENWRAKIANFGFSIYLPSNQDDDALNHKLVYGSKCYVDPEYMEKGKLKRESDVYSFGVVLFEVLCGSVAFNEIYVKEGDQGLANVTRRWLNEGLIEEMLDPMLKEEIGKNRFTLAKGPNKNSLNTFFKIACQCVAQTQDQRPTMNVVVEELEKALVCQENNKDDPKISLEDIKMATQNFDDVNCIGRGGFGNVYIGKVPQDDGFDIIVAKRLDITRGQGEQQFRNELQILFKYKHENVIRLFGYCDEKDEKVIVYEYASRGSLDRYLNDVRLTWMKRLTICVDIATALEFLHGGGAKQAAVIHRDIKTENILLNDEWKAKLSDYGLSLISAVNKETDYVIDRACGTRGYVDPVYLKSGFLTMESDIYSFGVVLFEILCGRSTFEIHKHEGHFLPSFIKQRFEKGNHDEVVFEDIKTQIAPKALNEFQTIAYQCLHDVREQRPTAKHVLKQLKKALKFQVTT